MSHISVYKTELMVQSSTQLKQFIRELGQRLNLTVTEGHIQEYYGGTVRCDIGLKSSIGLQYGIGFTADKDGKVEIIGDQQMQHRFDEVAKYANEFIKASQVAQKAVQQNPFARTTITLKDRKTILEVEVP